MSLRRAMQAVAAGRSVFIMPEGGIVSDQIPQMKYPFKDGAFLVAIDQQVPIVPISFLNLHDIMPAAFLFKGQPKIHIHAPIPTLGLTRDDLPALKERIFHIIQDTLNRYDARS
jgi:1-acyl-sn-glycerol-3-phosphate acyltransferase